MALRVEETYQTLVREVQQKQELERCRIDPVYFISNYLQIYETRPQYGIGFKPFKLWKRQEQYVSWLENTYLVHTNGMCEKCRDMGATLVTLAWIYWHWLFDKDFTALLGSLKVDEVKLRPGHDSLFAKLRDFLDTTPKYMLPKGFNSDHDMMSLSLTNPVSGNTITGAHCTEEFGRSRRSSVVLVDEYAFWDFDISGNLAYTSDTAVYVSTVNGMNQFYDLKKVYEPQNQCFVFNWSDSDNHTQAWYDQKKRDNPPHVFAREVERNYKSSVEGQIYAGIMDVIEHRASGDYDYNPEWKLACFWDYGLADKTYIGFLQKDPDTEDLYLIDEIVSDGHPIEWYVPFIPGKVVTSAPYRHSPADMEKIGRHKEWKGYGGMVHYGDPTGNQRTAATGQSVFDILRPYGIAIRCGPGWQDMFKRQQMATLALQRLYVNKDRCPYFLDSFSQFVYPKRSASSQSTAAIGKGIHKWSHAPSAFEAFALSEKYLRDTPVNNTVVYNNPWTLQR